MRAVTTKGDSGSTATTAAVGTDIGTAGTPANNHSNRPSTEGATPPGTNSDGEAASANNYDTVSQTAGSTAAPTTNAKADDTTNPGDSDSSTAASHTTAFLLHLIVSYACRCCCDGGCACVKWCALNVSEDQRRLNCFCDEYWLRFPWTSKLRGVRGSFPFNCYLAFVLLCALHLLLCVRPLCVSAAPLVSPVSLHFPHCADQLHTTERPHSR
ncbi:trans-sialidase [Trypanosoma cruzi]|nr:trans-sialidase [Trypanosoma cruzi]